MNILFVEDDSMIDSVRLDIRITQRDIPVNS